MVLTHGFDFRPFLAALRASRPAASMTDGFDVFVHEVIAAIATAPWSSVNDVPVSPMVTGVGLDAVFGAWLWWWCTCDAVGVLRAQLARVGRRERLRDRQVDEVVVDVGVVDEVLLELVLRLGQDDAVLRALRAGDRRDDGATRSSSRYSLKTGSFDGSCQSDCSLEYCSTSCDLLLAAAGEAQVVEGHVVDREHGGGRAELGAHVADGGAVRERDLGDAGAVELDELADHAVLAQHLRDGEHDVGGGDAGRDGAGQLEADDLRDEHRDGLAEHGRLGLDAADAPAEHAEAVDHGGVRVGADAGVGVGLSSSPSTSRVMVTRARYSMLTWCTMPVPGGTTLKSSNAVWPQRRNW